MMVIFLKTLSPNVFKNTDLSIENECLVSAKAYKMGGSRTFLEIDDKVSIDELLKGIIIQSGNDASIALAECLAGTEDDFAKLMNVYAKRLPSLVHQPCAKIFFGGSRSAAIRNAGQYI